jgi:hypothetical protein
MGTDWRQSSPRAETAWTHLSEQDLSEIYHLDRRTLARKGIDQDPATSPFSLRAYVRSLEWMVTRMQSGWPPHGYYLIDEYVNDLRIRDRISRDLDRLPPRVALRLRPLIDSFDAELWEHTIDDVESALLRHDATDQPLPAWWWRRVPDPLPWAHIR